MKKEEENRVYRIIDANLNRLREGLRSAEEYLRFSKDKRDTTSVREIRGLRQEVKRAEGLFSSERLLHNRETDTDPFSSPDPEIDPKRKDIRDILKAGLKRAQEASRVIEEYSLILNQGECIDRQEDMETSPSSLFKRIRFRLYNLEKDIIL